jgi:hypothetical protein
MVIASSTPAFRAVNSAPNVEVCTEVCRLERYETGVEPSAAKSPAIERPETLPCA